MKKQSIFDKLNLRPNERRLVIIVGIVVFIVLNALFVWPRFGDWGKIKARRNTAENLIHQYEREIGNTKRYQLELAKLREQGAEVQPEDQASKFSTTVQNQAALSGVQVDRYTPQPKTSLSTRTNQFFEEQVGSVNVTTEEKNLVDFLYNLGTGGSFIRVRSMTLNPDPQRYRLQGNIQLVASYSKKQPTATRAGAGGASTPRPAPASTNSTTRPGSPFGARTNSASR